MKEKMDFRNACYKTKQDKEAARIVSKPLQVSQEHWNRIFGTEEERQERLRKFKEKKSLEKKAFEIDAPQIAIWDMERTVLSTGKRMTKRQLKEYCRTHGKIWENQ